MAGKSQNQQERVLQACYLIPSYQKALPHALLHECSDDYRLRKIEAACSCKISWGRLPPRVAERYCLLRIQLDSKRGNHLGALNLLRQYFLGNAALIPFHLTLLRSDGNQVTKRFPTSQDDCRLLMPRCDRFGRIAADLAAAVAAVAGDKSAAAALRRKACDQLAEQLMDSVLRCLAVHVAFLQSEASGAAAAKAAEKAAVLAAATAEAEAKAVEDVAEMGQAAETLAQCEISRGCVYALVEAAEAVRLLERLDDGRRRCIDFRLAPPRTQSPSPVLPPPPSMTTTVTTRCQANNHHKPANRSRDRNRRPQQQWKQQPQQPQCQGRSSQDESCTTTLADVEVITFAESEYVAAGTSTPEATLKAAPEKLLLCGLQPGAASALSALDRSDRRLKTVERRTGCRLELHAAARNSGGGGGATSQQVSYALQVVPLRSDARPRGCVNMIRSLLHGLDPSYRFCVVGESQLAAAASAGPQQHRHGRHARSKSSTAFPAAELSEDNDLYRRLSPCRSLRVQSLHPHQRRRRSPTISLTQLRSAAVVSCASRLLRQVITDCALGASATAAAVAVGNSNTLRRQLEVRCEAVLSDALICVFRSLTANEADARLLGEALDADSLEEESRMIQDAVYRTLVACADERCVRGHMGAFACLPPTQLASRDEFQAGTASVTTTIRRRLARLTLACWESLCSDALCSSAAAGAGELLDAAITEAVTEASMGQLTGARLTLTATTLDRYDSDKSEGANIGGGGTSFYWHQTRPHSQQILRRQRRSPSELRRVLSVLAVKRLLADKLGAAVSSRVTVAATLAHLAVNLVAEQVWSTCLETQLAMRLRLREK